MTKSMDRALRTSSVSRLEPASIVITDSLLFVHLVKLFGPTGVNVTYNVSMKEYPHPLLDVVDSTRHLHVQSNEEEIYPKMIH